MTDSRILFVLHFKNDKFVFYGVNWSGLDKI
jgi:hypothetical protein